MCDEYPEVILAIRRRDTEFFDEASRQSGTRAAAVTSEPVESERADGSVPARPGQPYVAADARGRAPNRPDKERMNEPFNVRDLVEVSRAALASMGSNIDAASGALNAILAAESRGLFELWNVIDEQIGRADGVELREMLIEFRVRFVERAGAAEGWSARKEASTIFERRLDCVADRPRRVRSLIFGTHSVRGWQRLASRFRGGRRRRPKMVLAVQCLHQGRWSEAYDQIEKLSARPFLPTEVHARLLVLLGQISALPVPEVQIRPPAARGRPGARAP